MPDERDAVEAGLATMHALADDPDVFETFFEHARIGLALADLSGCYVRVNAAYAELLGRHAEDLVGVALGDVLEGGADASPLVAALLTGHRSTISSEQSYLTPGGQRCWVLHAVAAIRDRQQRPAWFALSAQDTTERQQALHELRELTALLTERAVRDPLTGLANRGLLEERLRAALARDARSGGTTGVLFLDLNGFKQVNDEYGHAAGDTVLKTVADRLSHAVRPSDTVARLGGDEFVVLVEGAGREGLDRLSQRLRTAVTEPIELAGVTVQIGVSVGVAMSEKGRAEPAALLSQADARMYRAKRGRR